MSAFQVPEIASTVREVLESPGESRCATFEIEGVDNAWAQVMKGSLNLAYPFPNPPSVDDVAAHLPGAVLVAWEANNFATFGFEGDDANAIARAVDHLFTKYFGRREYSVADRVEDL